MLAVALHVELLEVGRQVPKVVIIGQDCYGLSAEEVVVPDANESQQHGQVTLKGSRAEMLVHGVESGEHLVELFRAKSDHQGQAYGGVIGVATTDPVPELEHVGGVDTEFRHLLGIRRDGN